MIAAALEQPRPCWAGSSSAASFLSARHARVGIWATAFETPWDFRSKRWAVAQQNAPDGCPIKGNISKNGERIYHTPWSHAYGRTAIDAEAGERWFCSEADAIAAGWRPPLR